jgi:hypothetical protein
MLQEDRKGDARTNTFLSEDRVDLNLIVNELKKAHPVLGV